MVDHIAIVGPICSGKSTTAILLANYYAEKIGPEKVAVEFEGPLLLSKELSRQLDKKTFISASLRRTQPEGRDIEVFIYDGRIPIGATKIITLADIKLWANYDGILPKGFRN